MNMVFSIDLLFESGGNSGACSSTHMERETLHCTCSSDCSCTIFTTGTATFAQEILKVQ